MTDDRRSAEGRSEGEHADGGGVVERDVRAMLHRAVAEVQPDPGALPRIQRAVPRRRARNRHIWTGTAAVVLLTAAAVPTIRNADRIDLSDSPATRGRALADSSPASTAGPRADRTTSRPHAPRPTAVGAGTAPAEIPSSTAGSTVAPATAVGGTPGSTSAVPPTCRREDLGRASSHLSAADGSGKVYGWFTVLNTSGRSCALTGAGTVQIGAVSGMDPAQVKVVDHRAGDPAYGLPDPAAAPDSLVLQPLAGYRVQFGWVPDAPCPSPAATKAAGSGASGAAKPVAGASPAGASAAGAVRAADAGGPVPGSPSVPSPATGSSDSASPATSASPTVGPTPTATSTAASPAITLVHTPQSGGTAAATAVLNGVCAGTVYRAAPQGVAAGDPTAASQAGG